jgi:hypothetical protein
LEAWLTHVPGIKVLYPSNPIDAKGMLLAAINDPDPVVVLESIMLLFTQKAQVPTGDYRIPLGVAKVCREGSDVTLISYGWELHSCLADRPAIAGADRLSSRFAIGDENGPCRGRSCCGRILRSGCGNLFDHQRGAMGPIGGAGSSSRRGLRADGLLQRD